LLGWFDRNDAGNFITSFIMTIKTSCIEEAKATTLIKGMGIGRDNGINLYDIILESNAVNIINQIRSGKCMNYQIKNI
jgi:hypothetical protein